jgi:hypothetical protein
MLAEEASSNYGNLCPTLAHDDPDGENPENKIKTVDLGVGSNADIASPVAIFPAYISRII